MDVLLRLDFHRFITELTDPTAVGLKNEFDSRPGLKNGVHPT